MDLIYKVKEDITINDILTQKLNISSRLKNKLIKNKCVLLNNSFIDTRNYAHNGDIIKINLGSSEDNSNILPKKMNLQILYEDEHFLAINKPAGLAVHPSILHFDNSLANGVKYYFNTIGLKKKIRIINRIDFNTSGIVLFAKNEYVQECLIKQMHSKCFEKVYLGIVMGKLTEKKGTISLPIARKENSIIERCVSDYGDCAITHYKVLHEFEKYSLIKCILETGKTHQIRVHMAYIGHALLGDSLYGLDNQTLINRQALHSYKMVFIHPIFNTKISITAPIPNDIMKLLRE